MPLILETARLRLREMEDGDLPFVASMLGDAEVMRHYPKTLDQEEARLWLERQEARYARDGHGLWLVETREGPEPVGQVGLILQELDDGVHPEVAYLVHRRWQRRGFATEAATAVRDHAFQALGYPYVVSFIRPENVPSQKVAWKLGMEPTRVIRRADLDHIVFRVERADCCSGARSGHRR
jgi:ribosomal-protein-alanine N-acetyltransferase